MLRKHFGLVVGEVSAILKNDTIRKSIWLLINVIMYQLQLPVDLCKTACMIHYVFCSWFFYCETLNILFIFFS